MKHELPKLPYELNALEPHISLKTMEYHYGKHHNTYVVNLNNLIPGTEFENADLETIVKKSTGPIFNNGAQVWNHSFYFMSFSPKGGGEPKGKLAELIARDFGSFPEFKDKFSKAAAGLFGAGWAWLVMKHDGKLEIVQESNAGNPLRNGMTPILTCDVWEHAYYLDKQNRRPDYIASFWELIDWKVVEKRV
ncbi:MAG: superoxide dismutase [Bacteroidetes bacterium GWF2_38_335]|nr:MAG: superoxide dismutase [Bacteroidetes bacterium GWF2_38_335]OFY77826.1 MAG: superoxide dismutase [Bacteroidetes bacterium RIFOXYA12_FULL_38_20]HBS87366.1 superoxide dismutase [Bacteroidales bacterium]